MLSEAALESADDMKLLGWIGHQLGDTQNASRSLLAYAMQMKTQTAGERMHAEIDAYHATELAARLLFQGNIILFYDEMKSAIHQLRRRMKHETKNFFLDSSLGKLEEWISIRNGFGSYLRKRIARSSSRMGRSRPKSMTLSMQQRSVAEKHFLVGAMRSFPYQLRSGIRWFERSAEGNEAPWIQGTRALLSGIVSSLNAFSLDSPNGNKMYEMAQRSFRKSSRLLGNSDPIALSIAFRGLFASRHSVLSGAIVDLTRASAMLSPRTPEVAELRERILDARWKLIEQGSRGHHGATYASKLWSAIVALGPLLDHVIDEDNRLQEHFARIPRVWEFESSQMTLDDVLRVKNNHSRGKLLEDLIVRLVENSGDLAVVDVRHGNTFEEIDIIAKLVRPTPVLEYFGPIFIIECKNWKDAVGTDPLRSFYAKMATKKGAVRLGIFVAPGGFTSAVKEQIRQLPDSLILTITGRELAQVISGEKTFGNLVEEMASMSLFQ
jgi:hypothetical protein